VSLGVAQQDISTVAQDSNGEYAKFLRAEANTDSGSHVGASVAVGSIGGLVLGLAALSIPGLGPVIAAGPLAAAFAGAAIGAATGSLVGALNGSGVPEFEAKAYDQGIREGSTLVIVSATDDLVNHVIEVMRQHYAVWIDQYQHKATHGEEATLS
jgi:hypothetical protein